MNSETHNPHPAHVPLAQFTGYFLWLGTVGFGGPIALAGRMQQDLVDGRGWVSREDYVAGLALAQLAPGPLAAQLAMYLGYVRAGVLGATLVGIAFVLPSFLMVLVLSAAYVRYGGLDWMQAFFYGIGAAVIGIIARSAVKLTKLTLGKEPLLWGIFLVLAVSTAWTSREIIWLVVAGGVINLAVKAIPRRRTSIAGFVLPLGLALPASGPVLQIFLFFAKAGLFVFGSGLAIVPFLYGGVVEGHHWLNDRQFVDGGRGHDHSGSGRDYGGLHRICCGGSCGRHGCVARSLSSCLSHGHAARAFVQALGEESATERVCARSNGRRYWSDCRLGRCIGPPLDLRLAHGSYCLGHSGSVVQVEGAGAVSDRSCGGGGIDAARACSVTLTKVPSLSVLDTPSAVA